MENLYHLSHFFAFLCSVYFGSAILIFIEKDIIERLYDPFNEKLKDIGGVRLLLEDYKQLLTTKMLKDVGLKDIILSKLVSDSFAAYDRAFYKMLIKRKAILDNWKSQKNRMIMLKMFFPTFLFTGLYCLTIILMSGFQETNLKDSACYKAVDCFLIDLSIATLAFQFVSLILIPWLVNKVNYFNLMFIILLITVALFVIVSILSDNFFTFHAEWLLLAINIKWLQLVTVLIAFVPLLYLIVSISYQLNIYVMITAFYSLTKIFINAPIEKVVEKDIQEIQPEVK